MAKDLESPDGSDHLFRGSEGDRRLQSLCVLSDPINLSAYLKALDWTDF